MYKFNSVLWNRLHALLGIPKMELYSIIGTSTTPCTNVGRKKTIRLTWLVDICNRFHISIRSFIIEDGMQEIPDMLIIPKDRWQPIRLQLNLLHQCYTQGIGGCTRDEFMKEVSYSPSMYGKYVRNAEEPTLMSENLLRVCNRWNYSPWNVIIDNNYQPTVQELLIRVEALERRIAEIERGGKVRKGRIKGKSKVKKDDSGASKEEGKTFK